MCVRHLRCRYDLVVRSGGAAHKDVTLDGIVEEHRLLCHDAHTAAQRLLLILAHRDTVEEHIARSDIVEAGYKLAERRLTTTRSSHEGHGLALAYFEAYVVDNIALAIVREAHITQLDRLLKSLKLTSIGTITHATLCIEELKDTLTGSHTLVDVGKLVDKGAERACDLREGGDEGDEASTRNQTLTYERTTKDKDYGHRRDAQELAHRRCELLAARHRDKQVRHIGIDAAEPIDDEARSVVALDNLHTRQRLVEHRHKVAHTLLTPLCGVAQALDDATDDDADDRQEDDGKERELPRDANHKNHITDDEEWVAEGNLQGVGDAELHDHNILRNFRHNIALALVAEEAHIHIHHMGKDFVTHTLYGVDSQVLHGHCRGVAEEVAKQVHSYGHTTQQSKELNLLKVLTEAHRIEVRQYGVEALLVELQRWERIEGYELKAAILGEHSVEDGDDHRIVKGIKHGVQRCKEEVWHGVSTQRLCEAQQSEIGLYHCLLY